MHALGPLRYSRQHHGLLGLLLLLFHLLELPLLLEHSLLLGLLYHLLDLLLLILDSLGRLMIIHKLFELHLVNCRLIGLPHIIELITLLVLVDDLLLVVLLLQGILLLLELVNALEELLLALAFVDALFGFLFFLGKLDDPAFDALLLVSLDFEVDLGLHTFGERLRLGSNGRGHTLPKGRVSTDVDLGCNFNGYINILCRE